jgi:hypothetical protein
MDFKTEYSKDIIILLRNIKRETIPVLAVKLKIKLYKNL